MTDHQPGHPHAFDASTDDFVSQARQRGWPFWRGVLVGFCAAFPLAYMALVGYPLFGIG